MTQLAAHIEISILTKRWVRAEKQIVALCRRSAKAALRVGLAHIPKHKNLHAEGRRQEVSIALASDTRVRTLNRTYRGKDKPTNALSFPMDSHSLAPPATRDEPILLGDVILAFETCKREAASERKPFQAHAAHLVVHGVLHLLGYDHVVERDARKMERLEKLTLDGLGFPDPYAETAPKRMSPSRPQSPQSLRMKSRPSKR